MEFLVFRGRGLQQAVAGCSVTVVFLSFHKARLFQTPGSCGSLVLPAYHSPAEGAEIFPVSLNLSLTPSPGISRSENSPWDALPSPMAPNQADILRFPLDFSPISGIGKIKDSFPHAFFISVGNKMLSPVNLEMCWSEIFIWALLLATLDCR